MTLPYCQHNVLVCKRWVTSVLMSVRCGTFLLLHRKAIYNFWWREPNESETPLNCGQTKWNTWVFICIVYRVCQICRICFANSAASSIIIISSVISKGKATMSWWSCTWLFYCLFYGCEVWSLSTSNVHKINVVWNNGFRRILVVSGERVLNCYKFYSNSLRATLIVDERKVLFCKKCFHLRMRSLRQFRIYTWCFRVLFCISCYIGNIIV